MEVLEILTTESLEIGKFLLKQSVSIFRVTAHALHFFGNKEKLRIDQFRYIKIQPKTIDLSTTLLGINPTNSVFIPTSLVLRSIVLG